MRFYAVDADSDHDGALFFERLVIIPEAACFGGATGREVFRIEVKHHDVFSEEVF